MGLTAGEANAVNWVVKHALGLPTVPLEQVLEGMEMLAGRAQKTLLAGLGPKDIRPAFEKRQAVAAGDVLDGAMHSVWLHGKWRWLTSKMSLEEREAAADAVLRYSASLYDDSKQLDPQSVRWWR